MTSQTLFCFLVLLITTQLVFSFSFTKEIMEDCQKELEYEGDLRKLSFSDSDFPKKAKCVYACALKKSKVMREDKTLDKDVALSFIEENVKDKDEKEKMIKILDSCIEEVKILPCACETAFQYMKCRSSKN